MSFANVAIPLNLAWSSPFARWQGSLSEVSSLDLAAEVTRAALERGGSSPEIIDQLVFGWTVPQPEIFYGAPTLAGRVGAPAVAGPMLSQACATSAACVASAARSVEHEGGVVAVVTSDRTSNGPTLLYPRPSAPGGKPASEHWVLDNFQRDPWGGKAMIDTAEGVAASEGISREELDEVTLLRYEQYQASLADDRAFQRRYMVDVQIPGRRGPLTVEADEGIHETTAEGLAKLRAVNDDGVVTFGSQTHPADGTAGCVVTTHDRARELAGGNGVVRVLGTGLSRVGRGEMPRAPVPAAQAALNAAGVDISDIKAVTTHNPFAVNDVYFARQTGFPLERMNQYGCSLIYGHPQGPTGGRLIVELAHTLRELGGGLGLFTGCAAGDTGAAVVISVDD